MIIWSIRIHNVLQPDITLNHKEADDDLDDFCKADKEKYHRDGKRGKA